ncbi:AAA family ATPase [Bacillus lacus]|uniref:AAA family ATPase n=1 Tax=Metabacillus lacus TaxID=1983721 RepID=A0A7X2LZD7_9BACI|nr:ATP-binding protein [Metabacillus lacus]MRX72788.1 AAA family ATPase [Metabacillus lacus]
MSTFNMIIGLPGSGKSTFARKLAKNQEAVILSSDKLREEMLGDINNQASNESIFEELNRRVNEHLANGINVIYDATNTNRKRRKHLINHVIKCDKKIAHYVNEHYHTVLKRNNERDRKVSREVIDKMYKNMQIPLLNEGWDDVVFVENTDTRMESRELLESLITEVREHDELFTQLQNQIDDFTSIINVPHDSTYHSFSISRHTYYVWEYILTQYHGQDKMQLLWAALFHDLGKGFCKSFVNYKGETGRYANYIGHEHISSQMAVYWLTRLGYHADFIRLTNNLVQMHMMPMKASEKKMNEIETLIGLDAFEKLMILHEADLSAK